MKKVLLATTAGAALFAGSAFAQQVTTTAPFTVSLGLDFRHEFGYIDDDLAGGNDREMRTDYRLIFAATAKADNGLEYGAWLRIRNGGGGQPNGDGLRSDYKYIWAQGSWGRVELGDNDGANSITKMAVNAPTVGIGQIDGTLTNFIGGVGYYSYSTNGNPWAYNDQVMNTKVSYFTPRFSGFQAGISYTPEEDRGNSIRRTETTTGASGTIYEDLVEIGLNYTATFSGVGVKVGGGYSFADAKSAAFDELGVWMIGAQVSYAGFTVGGGYYDNDDAGFTSASGGTTQGWNLGVSYAIGPWGIAAQYSNVNVERSVGGDLDDTLWSIGGTYTLAPGLSLNLDWVNFDTESARTATGGVGVAANEGNLVVLRTRVRF